MKSARRRIDVNLEELDQVLDSALEAPLSEADHNKLKDTLACDGGAAGALAQYGEDQRGGWRSRKTRRQSNRRMTMRHRRPATAAMGQRRLVARAR